ncbi:MAG: methyltransferase domain-containing protein [Eubacteriales bacterium]
MATYDKYYKDENYFGNPYPELINFFSEYPQRGKLVDLGAGQGRDSVPLSNMGYEVTSVDISDVGLDQIRLKDKKISIFFSDVYSYDISDFDFILLDSMLHFYKNDFEKESKWVQKILSEMKKDALFINCLLKSAKAEKALLNIIQKHDCEFEILENKYIDYAEANCKYHFLVIKKI